MAERNTDVPLPELGTNFHQLEQILYDMALGILPSFDSLPQEIHAGDAELYANWISDLTQQDPRKRERGSIPHVKRTNQTFIYPSNPDVGSDSGCNFEISQKRDVYAPTINIHSHPVDVPHSALGGDMKLLINGSGFDEKYYNFPGILVASPEHNYLIIKTDKTPTEKVDVSSWSTNAEEFYHFQRYGTTFGRHNEDEVFWPLLKRIEEEILDLSFTNYYANFMETFAICERLNMGFYRSDRDGTYTRVTKEMLLTQMSDFLDKAFQAVQQSTNNF